MKTSYSILIPNYGYSGYLSECLRSVTKQIDEERYDVEIILCDQSEKAIYERIKKETAALADNMVKVVHCDVPSVLRARHTLLSLAKNEYIIFVDSDDFLGDDFLLRVNDCLDKAGHPDILFHGWIEFQDTPKGRKIVPHAFSSEILSDPMDYFEQTNVLNSVWMKVFKRSLYSKDDYDDINVINGDDKILSYPLMRKAGSIVFANEPLPYMYRQHSASIVHALTLPIILNAMDAHTRFPKPATPKQKQLRIKNDTDFAFDCIRNLRRKKSLDLNMIRTIVDRCRETMAVDDAKGVQMSAKTRLKYYLITHKRIRTIKFIVSIPSLHT